MGLSLVACGKAEVGNPEPVGTQQNPQAEAPFPTESNDIRFGEVTLFNVLGGSEEVARQNFYYFPKSVEKTQSFQRYKTLVFLHGGGESTATQPSASKVALRYLKDYVEFAEANQVLLIFPTTPYGWNLQTRYYLRDLLAHIKTHYPVAPDKIVLTGHSMGGMGITREFAFIHQWFRGVLGQAAGARESSTHPYLLQSYFYTPYIHLNGINDHFTDFEPWMKALERKLHLMEIEQGRSSAFELIFHKGNHQPNRELNEKLLNQLFDQELPTFQPELYGILEARNYPLAKVMPPVKEQALDTVKWIQAKNYVMPTQEEGARIRTLTAKLVSNREIQINLAEVTGILCLDPERLEVSHLDHLVDKKKKFKIFVNGAKAFSGKLKGRSKVDFPIPRKGRCQ